MSNSICNYLGNDVLNEYVRDGGGDGKGAWLALFTGTLTAAGLTASEVIGGDYERVRPLTPTNTTGWSTSGSKTIGNSYPMNFENLPEVTVTWFGLMTAQAGGNMLMTLQLPVPRDFEVGDDFLIDANALAFTL